MTVKSLVWVAIVTFVQGVAAQDALLPGRALPAAKTVHRSIDPKSGLEIRIRQDNPREAVVEVADGDVAIHKVMTPTQTVTTLSSGRDQIRLTTGKAGMDVQENDGPVVAISVQDPALGRMADVLAHSPAARDARRLLAKLDLSPATFSGNALLLTRAMLELPSGTRTAIDEGLEWRKTRASRPNVTKVSFSAGGPGECWSDYEQYVTKIWDDYGECFFGCRWYQVGCETTCEFVWALRAELAMDWLIACSGGMPVR